MIRAVAFVFVVFSGAAHSFQGVPCETPLTASALEQLVGGGVPAARLRQLILSCGLDLVTPDLAAAESQLKQIGVPAAALTALRPPASGKAGTEWISPFDKRRMMSIPAGSFRMGSAETEPGRDVDEVSHFVTFDAAFWMDADEVTNEAFRRFVLASPEWQPERVRTRNKQYLRDWNGTNFPEGAAARPVVWVDWEAARAYAAWAGKRLPTEGEWEYAARAGAASSVAAAPEPHPWGLRNVGSGVWEWTSSLYRPYPFRPDDGRELANAPGSRVIRGGSSANAEVFRRPANRSFEDPAKGTDLLGFRCAR